MMEERKVPALRFQGFTDEWEERKLGEIVDSFEYGLNAPATEYDGKNKYIRITDIDDKTHHFLLKNLSSPNVDVNFAKNYRLKEGDILFARTGASVGKSYIYRQSDGLVYYAGFLIRAHVKKNYDSDFVYQNTLTSNYSKYISITSQRSGQPGVNAQEYSEYRFMVPSLLEQKKISRLIMELDQLIFNSLNKLTKLQSFKKSMLEKMFPRPGEKVPEVRFRGFTGDWEEGILGEMASFSKGSGYSKSDLQKKGTPVILYGRLYTNYETLISHIDTFVEPKSGSVYSQGREVIVPASGETAEDISRASVIGREGVILGGDLNIIYPKGMIHPLFLAISISHGKPHKDMAKRAQGKTIVHLHGTDLAQVNLLYPSIDEQKQIGLFFYRLENFIAMQQRKLEKLESLKQAMLSEMFI